MITGLIGNMGSGKSARLIKYYNESKKAKQAFKPKMDSRTPGLIASRNGSKIEALEVSTFYDILNHLKDHTNIEEVYIDELQFMKEDGLGELFCYLITNNISLTASGLDLSTELKPFKVTGLFICYADRIYKITSRCKCNSNNRATLTDCLIDKTSEVLVGGDDIYIRACKDCHSLLKKIEKNRK